MNAYMNTCENKKNKYYRNSFKLCLRIPMFNRNMACNIAEVLF